MTEDQIRNRNDRRNARRAERRAANPGMPRESMTVAQKASKDAATKRWRKANPDKVKAGKQRSYQTNKDRILAKSQVYRATNTDKLKAYRTANRDKRSESFRRWKNKNVEHVRSITRERHFKKYGLTVADRDALLAEQGSCCALCGSHDAGKAWSVDHDHSIGPKAVRGILCTRCNLVLGKLGDSAESVDLWTACAKHYLDVVAKVTTPARIAKVKAKP